MNDLDTQVALFLSLLAADHAAYWAAQYPNLTPPRFTITSGQKFIRVIRQDRHKCNTTGEAVDSSSSSAYCFIDRSNGDLLKCDGYKKPAKGKRGSIYNANCDVGKIATAHGGGFYR